VGSIQRLDFVAALGIEAELDPLAITGMTVPGSAGPITGTLVREARPACEVARPSGSLAAGRAE
jgi:hypothetical protein